MNIGIIDWFVSERGFGVIKAAYGKMPDAFFHISNWHDKKHFFSEPIYPLVFYIGLKKGKYSALNVMYFNIRQQKHRELLDRIDKYQNISVDAGSFNLMALIFDKISSDEVVYAENYLKHLLDKKSGSESLDEIKRILQINKAIDNEKGKEIIERIVKEKLVGFNSSEVFQSWQDGDLIHIDIPEEILADNIAQIGRDGLKRIQDQSLYNKLIHKKIAHLNKNFDSKEFHQLNGITNDIEDTELAGFVKEQLNEIALSFYYDHLKQNLEEVGDIITETQYKYVKHNIMVFPGFIDTETQETIRQRLEPILAKALSGEFLLQAWKNHLIQNINPYLKGRIDEIPINHYEDLIQSSMLHQEIKQELLDLQFQNENYRAVLKWAGWISKTLWQHYSTKTIEVVSVDVAVNLLNQGLLSTIPHHYFSEYLDEHREKYNHINQWVQNDIITSRELKAILLRKIENSDSVRDRKDFYTIYNSIVAFIKHGGVIQELLNSKHDLVKLILWHLQYTDAFDLAYLKSKFIYFSPEEQVSIFKRLFYLKHQGELDFTFKEIDGIVRADIDLFLTNERFNDDFVLDISVHVIIEAIKNFIEKENFDFESDLIMKDLSNQNKPKFKIKDFFDKCTGRTIIEWDFKQQKGDVIKEHVETNGKKYDFFRIEFNYDADLVAKVRQLPGRRYNSKEKYWGVPLKYEQEVKEFARQNKFFINLPDKKHLTNNTHLIKYENDDIPDGILFCEGRQANKYHSFTGQKFWWCVNNDCHQNAVEEHLEWDSNNLSYNQEDKNIWDYYTLLDILRILKINVDEVKDDPNDIVPDGHYFKLVGHINAFNRLVEKLYCEECGELLYPSNTSHFALYRITRFSCRNENCSKFNEEIYLNHCLNGECTNVIDSRVSHRCENGMYICNVCGTCCSNEFFQRKLSQLQRVGAYIHPQLKLNAKNANGHLEKKEYYCYSCGGMMTEVSETYFNCETCNVKYDFKRYKWLSKKWKNIASRRNDYPIGQKNEEDNKNDIDDIF